MEKSKKISITIIPSKIHRTNFLKRNKSPFSIRNVKIREQKKEQRAIVYFIQTLASVFKLQASCCIREENLKFKISLHFEIYRDYTFYTPELVISIHN